nr:copia protein [Tanacetum cinerariifolium]
MESVKKSINERAQPKREYDSWVNEIQMQTTEEKVDTSKALDASLVDRKSNATDLKEKDTSSRLGNDAHDDDADIRPIYDEEPMAEFKAGSKSCSSSKQDSHMTTRVRITIPPSNNNAKVNIRSYALSRKPCQGDSLNLLDHRNKKDERGIMIKNKAILVTQRHTQEEGIDYDEVFAPVAKIEAIRLFMAYAFFNDFIVYQMYVNSAFIYGKIEKEVYVCQPLGFEDLDFLDKVYKLEKALYGLHHAPRACQDKYVADNLKFFDFFTIKTASTPMEPNKALVKDAKAKIDSLFDLEAYSDSDYTRASLDRKSITGCCQFHSKRLISWQVFHSQTKHIEIMHHFIRDSYEKKLIQVTKISLSNGPTNPVANETIYKEWEDRMERSITTASSLEAEQDNGNIKRTPSMATLNEPLPQGTTSCSGPRCQFTILGVQKLKLVYASCVKQFWTTTKVKKINDQEHIKALVDKQKVIIIKESIRRDLKFNDAEGTACLPNDTIFAELVRMGVFLEITPLFKTMMVNAQEEVGEGSGTHIDSYHIPTDTQLSFSKSQKKIKPKTNQRQAADVHSPSSEIPIEKSILTPSIDPLPSVKTGNSSLNIAGKRQSEMVRKRIERISDLKNRKRDMGINNRQSVV